MPVMPCAPVAPVRGIVVFDPAAFRLLFPEFATVTDPQLNFNFQRATLLLNNGCGSVVQAADKREVMLNQLTAHITALTNGVNGQAPAGIVGHVNSATQGSVAVSAEYGASGNPSQPYYLQTEYGALYWQMTLPFRNWRYIAPTCAPGGFPSPEAFGPGPYNITGGGC